MEKEAISLQIKSTIANFLWQKKEEALTSTGLNFYEQLYPQIKMKCVWDLDKVHLWGYGRRRDGCFGGRPGGKITFCKFSFSLALPMGFLGFIRSSEVISDFTF